MEETSGVCIKLSSENGNPVVLTSMTDCMSVGISDDPEEWIDEISNTLWQELAKKVL